MGASIGHECSRTSAGGSRHDAGDGNPVGTQLPGNGADHRFDGGLGPLVDLGVALAAADSDGASVDEPAEDAAQVAGGVLGENAG